jgi:hypothetical protein
MSNNENGIGFFGIILYLYLIISQIATLYFWWEWAQNNGFWSSIIIGPIVGELKGLLWIFFIW